MQREVIKQTFSPIFMEINVVRRAAFHTPFRKKEKGTKNALENRGKIGGKNQRWKVINVKVIQHSIAKGGKGSDVEHLTRIFSPRTRSYKIPEHVVH